LRHIYKSLSTGDSVSVKRVISAILGLVISGSVFAAEAQQYDRKFFVQLRTVFGRFRETDLDSAFDRAKPIQCSELINGEGEWRSVAFFNERRDLGDWYRTSLEEVNGDLTAFIFKGMCRGEHGPVQLTTKFPVTESIEAFQRDRIQFDQIAVNTNAPVSASFDAQTQAYRFELPYLFLVRHQDDGNIYSLDPPTLLERRQYATDVIDHWDCKSVTAENVTYQFLLCRTTTLPRNPIERNRGRAAFGASAYFILSDGKEASSSVRLTFDDSDNTKHTIEDVSTPPTIDDARLPAAWESPDPDEKILDVVRDEFRIRFAPQTWNGRIGSLQILSGKNIGSLDSFKPTVGADYCMWMPGGSAPAEGVSYSVVQHDQDGQTPTSITFKMATPSGTNAGSLQCIFPRATSAATVDFSRWLSTVGPHLSLEIKP
jgi:hypothetical protein